MKIIGIVSSIYLVIGICFALYGAYERHRENKKRGYRLEKYRDLIIVLPICILSRPFILYINITEGKQPE